MGGKQARLQWEVMTRPYAKGGFGILYFELYFPAAQAHYAWFWVKQPKYMPQVAAAHWLAHPVPLEGALFLPIGDKDRWPDALACTMTAWRRIRRLLDVPFLYSPLLPLIYHPAMPLLQKTVFHTFKSRAQIVNWGTCM